MSGLENGNSSWPSDTLCCLSIDAGLVAQGTCAKHEEPIAQGGDTKALEELVVELQCEIDRRSQLTKAEETTLRNRLQEVGVRISRMNCFVSVNCLGCILPTELLTIRKLNPVWNYPGSEPSFRTKSSCKDQDSVLTLCNGIRPSHFCCSIKCEMFV